MAKTRRNGGGFGRRNGKSRTLPSRTTPGPPTASLTRPVRTTAYEAKPTRTEITHQAIAEAAYFLWLRNGGDQVLNWLEAERLLKSKTGAGAR